MAEKKLRTRMVQKHDTEENWLKASGFIPKQGEIIVYDEDSNCPYERIKIGDGINNVNILPFAHGASMVAQNEAPIDTSVIWVDTDDNTVDEFQDAVNLALAQAKASGEFKGDPGATGPKPVPGVDYWTETDRANIIQQVLTELGAIPVYGTIDEDNNIYLTALLKNGTYYLKYADADGNVTDICTYEHNYVPKPNYKNLFIADTCLLNKCTNSSGNVSDNVGGFLTDYIDLEDAMSKGETNVLHYKGFYFKSSNWQWVQGSNTYPIYAYVAYYTKDKTYLGNTSLASVDDVLSSEGDYVITLDATKTTARYIRISAMTVPNPSSKTNTTALTSTSQLANCKIALNETITD